MSTITPAASSFAHQEFINKMQVLAENYKDLGNTASEIIPTLKNLDEQNLIENLSAVEKVVQKLAFNTTYAPSRLLALNGSYYEDPKSLLHQLYQQGEVAEKKFNKTCAERDRLQQKAKQIEPLYSTCKKIYNALKDQEMPTSIAALSDLQPILSQMLPIPQIEHQETLNFTTFVNTLILWHKQKTASTKLTLASTKIITYFMKQRSKIDSIDLFSAYMRLYLHNINLNQCSLNESKISKISNLIKEFILDDSFKKPEEFKKYILDKLAKPKPHVCIFPKAEKLIDLSSPNNGVIPQNDHFFYMTSLNNEIIREVFLRCVSMSDFQGLMRLSTTSKWFYREIIGPTSQGKGFIEQLGFSNWHLCRLPNLKISMDETLPFSLLNKELALIHKPTLMNAYKNLALHHNLKSCPPPMLIIKAQDIFKEFHLDILYKFEITNTKMQNCCSISVEGKPQLFYWSTGLSTRVHLLIHTPFYKLALSGS